jgi:PAS domain S-box-containing protein
MAISDHASFVLRRVRAWSPHDSGKGSILAWLVAPFLITATAFSIQVVFLSSPDIPRPGYVMLYPAVIISSLLGGYRAGLLATLLSIGGSTLLLGAALSTPDILRMTAFFVDCLLIVAVCHTMTVSVRRTAEAQAETRHAFQLLKGEQLFRSFVEHAPAALAMFDRDMRYIGASRRWMNDFKIEDASVRGKPYSEGSAAMPGEWAEARFKALAGEICRKEEDLIVHADGRQQWLRWELRPWGDISGIVAGIVIFCEDITQQKQAASAAAESEARLRAIIESMQGAMIVTDAEGGIESFNPAAVALFGYSETELLGSNIQLLIPGFGLGEEKADPSAEEPDVGGDDEDRLPDGSREAEGKRKGGETFPIDQMITQWSGIDGEHHWTVIVRDISERRAGEEELGRALRMEAIGRLAGGIAHDFNNLLSVITGNLELAEPHIPHAKAHMMVNKALGAAQRGAGFTQQLLTLAKKRQSEFSEVDLNQHVSNIAVLLEHTLGSNVRLRISLAPDLWLTRADPVEIDSAIINLAMNAGHAMPTGGTLYISTRNVTIDRKRVPASKQAGDFALLSVRDSGTGMTREVRRRAFEPFFTTKEEGAGTGLGLSSVYSFAQAAGGFITLDSAVGKGTTVEMYIPRFVGGRSSGPVEVKSRRKRGHGEIILVVEDDQEVRDVSIERLKHLGYATLSAGSMSEACQILRNNPQIALVFSDIVLTDSKTGYDLARWVELHRPDVNILLTTGYDIGDKELAQSKDNPLVRRLEKPHSTAQLADEIRKILEVDTPDEP